MRRIQRKRTKGWRMPEGAVYVGRPSRWGNPYRAGYYLSAIGAVVAFREWARQRIETEPSWLDPLRGQDLACWCPLDQPCHVDVLLEFVDPISHYLQDLVSESFA